MTDQHASVFLSGLPTFAEFEDVANLAAMAKHAAKQAGVGLWEREVVPS